MQTNNYSAQYGRNSSGVVTVLTKSGTNQFHGSVFEFFRDRNFNATTHLRRRRRRTISTASAALLAGRSCTTSCSSSSRMRDSALSPRTSSIRLCQAQAMLGGNFTENTPTLTTTPDNHEVHDRCPVGQQVLGVQSLSAEGQRVVRRGWWAKSRAEYLPHEPV